MKLRLVLFVIAGIIVVMAACRKKEVAPSSGPPPTPEFDSSENNLGYLNEGFRKFQQAKNRPPNDLNELVTEKVIARVPPPPSGFAYTIDRKSGLVTLQQAGQPK